MIHANSIEAYHDERPKLSERAEAILNVYKRFNRPVTDRQILDAMYPGCGDMNRVRPRVTELIGAGQLVEVGKVKDSVTGKSVRTCRVELVEPDRTIGVAFRQQCELWNEGR